MATLLKYKKSNTLYLPMLKLVRTAEAAAAALT